MLSVINMNAFCMFGIVKKLLQPNLNQYERKRIEVSGTSFG